MRRCTSNIPPPRASRRAPDVDRKLLAWGRSTAARGGRVPPLWLFTDSARLRDPRAAVARLPRGLAGVVFRHDDDQERAHLARDLARTCRARRLILVVAGDARLAAALGAGVHLRGGRWPNHLRSSQFVTSSAHSFADLRRAARGGQPGVSLPGVRDGQPSERALTWARALVPSCAPRSDRRGGARRGRWSVSAPPSA